MALGLGEAPLGRAWERRRRGYGKALAGKGTSHKDKETVEPKENMTLYAQCTQVARMAGSGTVEQMRRGVYRYDVGEETSHPHAKAVWLACYPRLTAAERLIRRSRDAVFACATTASLHGIGDRHGDPYTFIVRVRRQTTARDLSFHQWNLDDCDVTYIDTLPVE